MLILPPSGSDLALVKIKSGTTIPITATASLLNGIDLIEDVENQKLKAKVLSYLEGHKQAYISDICEHLDQDAETIIKILKKLKKEGRVREATD